MFWGFLNIDEISILANILLMAGLVLFVLGFFFFFVPGWMIKWNSIGNIQLRKTEDELPSVNRRLFWANYAMFRNHRITGGVMWGLSSLFLWVYILYVMYGFPK